MTVGRVVDDVLLEGPGGQDEGRIEEKYVPHAPWHAVGQAVTTDAVGTLVGQPHGTGISER